MNRPTDDRKPGAASERARLLALCLAFIAIDQLNDPLLDASLRQEVIYWLARVSALAGGLFAAAWAAARISAKRFSEPNWLRPVLLVTALGILPLVCIEVMLEPRLPMRPEFADDELRAISPALAFLAEYATVATILLPVHLILWLILGDRGSQAVAEDATSSSDSVRPAFLEQTRAAATEQVLALKAEEHYVRVCTDSGDDLVHYRFSQAVADMRQAPGLQVHRSWWVAERAVLSASRGSRRWQLELCNGLSVPVSDSYVARVREDGWLKRGPRGNARAAERQSDAGSRADPPA